MKGCHCHLHLLTCIGMLSSLTPTSEPYNAQAAAEAEALRRAKAQDQGRALRHVRLEPWDRHYYTAQAQARLHGGQRCGCWCKLLVFWADVT